jgi:transposase
MDYNFYSWNQDQMYLMPPSIREWLPADDYLWFLMDAVSVFDLRPFRRKYRSDGRGHPAYNPEMMVTLLIYAYSMGERFSRRIEKLCERDVAFRCLTANRKPDHNVICRFRQEFAKEIGDLFLEFSGSAGKPNLPKPE